MADPASLALTTLTTFKEVYLVSRFIYHVIASARDHQSELRAIQRDFYHELLCFLSFRHIMIANNGSIVDDSDLNNEWLHHLNHTLGQLRVVFAEYAAAAGQSDETYQRYSPFVNDHMFNTRVIEAPLEIATSDIPVPSSATVGHTTLSSMTSGIRAYFRSPLFQKGSWRWALFQKSKLTRTLGHFRAQNVKLKDVLPLFTATVSIARQSQLLRDLANEDVGDPGGISTQIRFREVVEESSSNQAPQLLLLEVDGRKDASVHALQSSAPADTWIEHKYYSPASPSQSQSECQDQIRRLATLLQASERYRLRTLPWQGYVHQSSASRYEFRFRCPPGSGGHEALVNLEQCLLGNKSEKRLARPSLQTKFAMASAIAKAVESFHAAGWVHKNICSQSVIFFDAEREPVRYTEPYLSGFEYARIENAETSGEYDDILEKNVYRHPRRQGFPTAKFGKIHDIYALGVVLLEIGLWTPVMSLYWDATAKLPAGRAFDVRGMKGRLQSSAKHNLSHLMGDAYRDAVLACISGELDNAVDTGHLAAAFHERVVRNVDIETL